MYVCVFVCVCAHLLTHFFPWWVTINVHPHCYEFIKPQPGETKAALVVFTLQSHLVHVTVRAHCEKHYMHIKYTIVGTKVVLNIVQFIKLHDILVSLVQFIWFEDDG